MSRRTITENRRARHDYTIEEKFEAGIVLQGTEVKSLRDGSVNLKDAFAGLQHGEVFLFNCHIAPYKAGNRFNHDPERPRKLLLHKRQIKRLIGKISERGYTLIPLKMYFNEKGVAKVELGLGKGRARQDRRHVIKERDMKRDLDRQMSHYE